MINLHQFQTQGVMMFHFLSFAECQTVLNELLSQSLTKAPLRKGNGIKQDFYEASINLDQYPKTTLKLKEVGQKIIEAGLLSARTPFNSFRIQQYPQGSTGISPHVDDKRFRSPIVILVLKPGGDLFIYKTKDDKNPVPIPSTVGDCIIITPEIIHGVKDIKQERYTITQRIDTTPWKPL
jgi:hypothetical protein